MDQDNTVTLDENDQLLTAEGFMDNNKVKVDMPSKSQELETSALFAGVASMATETISDVKNSLLKMQEFHKKSAVGGIFSIKDAQKQKQLQDQSEKTKKNLEIVDELEGTVRGFVETNQLNNTVSVRPGPGNSSYADEAS